MSSLSNTYMLVGMDGWMNDNNFLSSFTSPTSDFSHSNPLRNTAAKFISVKADSLMLLP